MTSQLSRGSDSPAVSLGFNSQPSIECGTDHRADEKSSSSSGSSALPGSSHPCREDTPRRHHSNPKPCKWPTRLRGINEGLETLCPNREFRNTNPWRHWDTLRTRHHCVSCPWNSPHSCSGTPGLSRSALLTPEPEETHPMSGHLPGSQHHQTHPLYHCQAHSQLLARFISLHNH